MQTAAVTVLKVDHVQLAMPAGGEGDAVAFYEGRLGLAQVPKPEPLAGRGGCWFERDDVRIHLGVEEPFTPARKAHPALLVTELRPLVAALEADGVAVSEAEPLAGFDRVHVLDPFGNRVELVEPLPSVLVLEGERVRLRPPTVDDIAELVRIRRTPEVFARWSEQGDLADEVREDVLDPEHKGFAIEAEGRLVGWIACYEEEDEDYRHAGMDLFLDPASSDRGLGTDAVRTMSRHLIDDRGHHRLVIDPAADNARAIRCYEKAGFRPVGVMRRYERGPDGTFHDSLLMDLLADDL